MARWISLLSTLAIICFWVLMNTQLVVREIEMRQMDVYPRAVNQFIGPELYRESWLAIYHKHRKIGYTGYTIERAFEDEGVRHRMHVRSEARLQFGAREGVLAVNGDLIADYDMIPISLDVQIDWQGSRFTLTGEREGSGFSVALRGGPLVLFRHEMPLEPLSLSNGLTVDIPMAGFEVGDTFEIPVYNPVPLPFFESRSTARVHVLEKTQLKVDGIPVDCFHLKTEMLGYTFDSWVTPEGETLKQKLPPPADYTLVKESHRRARRGVILTEWPPRGREGRDGATGREDLEDGARSENGQESDSDGRTPETRATATDNTEDES